MLVYRQHPPMIKYSEEYWSNRLYVTRIISLDNVPSYVGHGVCGGPSLKILSARPKDSVYQGCVSCQWNLLLSILELQKVEFRNVEFGLLDSAECFDLASQTWSALPPMPRLRLAPTPPASPKRKNQPLAPVYAEAAAPFSGPH